VLIFSVFSFAERNSAGIQRSRIENGRFQTRVCSVRFQDGLRVCIRQDGFEMQYEKLRVVNRPALGWRVDTGKLNNFGDDETIDRKWVCVRCPMIDCSENGVGI
jgi:hypothetical protein